SASLGWPEISVRTAALPSVGGAPGGAESAATASAARYAASLLPPSGNANRSDPQAGSFSPVNPSGLLCSSGSVDHFWPPRARCGPGRPASTTGEVTNDRLPVMVSLPAAAVSRAADTELPGIHSAGRWPRSAGQFPMKPSTTASEPADL